MKQKYRPILRIYLTGFPNHPTTTIIMGAVNSIWGASLDVSRQLLTSASNASTLTALGLDSSQTLLSSFRAKELGNPAATLRPCHDGTLQRPSAPSTGSHITLNQGKHTGKSVPGTNDTGLNPTLQMLLAGWLSNRVGCDSKEALAEVLEIVRSYLRCPKTIESAIASIDTSNQPSAHYTTSTQQTMEVRSAQLDAGTHSCKDNRGRIHHRGFSFLPGDDSAEAVSKHGVESCIHDSPNMVMSMETLGGRDGSSETSKEKIVSRLESSSIPHHHLVRATVAPTEQTTLMQPRRDGSNKSFFSGFRSDSGRSSSSSHKESTVSKAETEGGREISKLSANNHFAVAAARAAKGSS